METKSLSLASKQLDYSLRSDGQPVIVWGEHDAAHILGELETSGPDCFTRTGIEYSESAVLIASNDALAVRSPDTIPPGVVGRKLAAALPCGHVPDSQHPILMPRRGHE
jgi:hypothetical protein